MKKGLTVQQPEAPTLALPTLLQLIDQEQREDGWTDDDLEQHLGVEGLGLMDLMRKGVVQMAYRSAVDIEQKMHANVLAVLQALVRSHMMDAADCIPEIHARLSIGPDCSRLVKTYQDVVNGEARISTLKMPHATVWVVPNAAMKPTGEADA